MSPVSRPFQNGDEGAEREQVWEHVAHLVHEIDAQIVVVDADVDVHAADHEASYHLLEIVLDRLVALLLGTPLLAPDRERVRRRRDEPQTVGTGHRCHSAAQPPQIGTGLADGGAHPGADLDLALQEFRSDLPFEQCLALGQHRWRRRMNEVARVRIDEQILLFDPDGEAGLLHGWEGSWRCEYGIESLW